MSTTPSLFLISACILIYVEPLENGMARKPPMGWMSWGYYMCNVYCENNPSKCLNEQLILSVADKFYNEGYLEAGFEYIIIDDCWSEKRRNQFGRLVPDKKRFPRGMKYIADYIHKRGLKFGMYTNIAKTTCMGYPGSRGYFSPDANMFARWGVDYLKVDGCFVDESFLNVAYIRLGEHMAAAGRPMLYSCSWPYYIQFIHHKKPNYTNIAHHCNMWRNYHDVVLSWDALQAIIGYYRDSYEELSPHHGPGHWNDPDMLILGTGALTESQSRVHLGVYALLSAPLLLSCDMSSITEHERSLLLNPNLIAIAQDSLGVMAKPYQLTNSISMWVKPHLPRKGDAYSSVSFALVNLTPAAASVSLTPGLYGLNSTDDYTIMDIFSQSYLRNISSGESLRLSVPAEGIPLHALTASSQHVQTVGRGTALPRRSCVRT